MGGGSCSLETHEQNWWVLKNMIKLSHMIGTHSRWWLNFLRLVGQVLTHGPSTHGRWWLKKSANVSHMANKAMGNPTLLLVFLKASILSGKHSDQGSMIPEIHQDIRSRNKNIGAFGPGSCTEFRYGSCWHSHSGWRHRICKILPGGVETHSKTPIWETQIQGLKYIHSYDKGSWNHTTQYTFL